MTFTSSIYTALKKYEDDKTDGIDIFVLINYEHTP
jgi:hypothetical protein